MNPNRFDVVVGLVSPDFLEDQRRGHGLSVALQQAMQQLKFQMRQTHRAVEPDRLKPFRHQGEGAVAQDFVVVGGSDRGAITTTEQGFHPSLQFLEVEWFGQVIVSA